MNESIRIFLQLISWLNKGKRVLMLGIVMFAGVLFLNKYVYFLDSRVELKKKESISQKAKVLGMMADEEKQREEEINDKIRYWQEVLFLQPEYFLAYQYIGDYYEILGNEEKANEYHQVFEEKVF